MTDEECANESKKCISSSPLIIDLQKLSVSNINKLKQKPHPKYSFFGNCNVEQTILQEAEEALSQNFNKSNFNRMEIIGQYNLGFILAKLDNHLFIIDQHAADEKHTFEDLQKTTLINTQKLIQPILLDQICVDEELIIMNHLEIFVQNGFQIDCDSNAPPTKRLKILSRPFSKDTEFGIQGLFFLFFLKLI